MGILKFRRVEHSSSTAGDLHAADRRVEEILDADIRRLRAADPKTDQQWRQLQSTLEREPSPALPRKLRPFIARPVIGFALVVAALIVVGVLRQRQPSTVSYETAKGQKSTIMLLDSTEVTLNHTSELMVDRLPQERVRRVTLKGEAFFRVRSDGTPFIVFTDVATVKVLGTEFNVRVRDDHLEVAVVKGRVQVSTHNNGEDSSVVLAAGQIGTCVRGAYPEMPGLIPFSEYPGWMHGKFIFYRTSLLSVCRELESQFDVPIRIEDARLRDEKITGVVDGENVQTALVALVGLTGNKYRHENSGYTIY
jgi:transmembrane sensor